MVPIRTVSHRRRSKFLLVSSWPEWTEIYERAISQRKKSFLGDIWSRRCSKEWVALRAPLPKQQDQKRSRDIFCGSSYRFRQLLLWHWRKILIFVFEYHTPYHVTKHENILRQVSKLPRAPPDVRKKQRQSHTDVREETTLLHKQPSGTPNATTSTDAHDILYINEVNYCRNAYADVFIS